jgi:hypothetical protein
VSCLAVSGCVWLWADPTTARVRQAGLRRRTHASYHLPSSPATVRLRQLEHAACRRQPRAGETVSTTCTVATSKAVSPIHWPVSIPSTPCPPPIVDARPTHSCRYLSAGFAVLPLPVRPLQPCILTSCQLKSRPSSRPPLQRFCRCVSSLAPSDPHHHPYYCPQPIDTRPPKILDTNAAKNTQPHADHHMHSRPSSSST